MAGMSSFPVDFISLPLDIIEQITKYLSTNDLLACSLVCVGWREALNHDILWIKRCKGGYSWKRYAEHLESQQSVVEPIFKLPQSSEDTLEPLCTWRVHLMAQIHFRRNIESYNFKKFTAEGTFNNDNVYYEAENLVIMLTGLSSCEIWNIETLPHCEHIIYCALENIKPYFYIFDDFILILQLNLFQVYKKNNNTYELLHRRLFDLEEILSLNIPSWVDITNWYFSFMSKTSGSVPLLKRRGHVCFRNIFIGYNEISDFNDKVFYIWDLKSGTKLKEQKFKALSETICGIEFYKNKTFVYVLFETINQKNEKQTTIVGYNPVSLNYTNFHIDISCSKDQRYFYFDNNYVVTLHSNVIDVWDTSKTCTNKTYKDLQTTPFPFSLIIHDSKLIYAGNNVFSNHLTIIDINTLQKIQSLTVPCPIYRVMSSEANLLLMKCNTSDFYNFTRDIDEYEVSIWDLELSRKIFSFKIVNQFSGHLKFTKLVSIQLHQISVVHFW
uniref:F-box domain-containing protein n=2 Tax=Clastoptera arizonana TaxID=38151 RepID=A0A1B6DZG3_9HEMI